MKNLLFVILILLFSVFLSACNKNEFKETKIAPASTNMLSTVETSNSKELPPGHPPIDGKTSISGTPAANNETRAVNVENIAKAKGGVTVADCFEKKETLKNTKVIIRGKVIKYNTGIMGKNWIHLRDGSGTEGKNDIVVTTDNSTKVNDTITVTGILSTDKDIGSGYFFPVIIENASIKVE